MQSRYSADGHWYARLHRFPAALFDRNGYLFFATEAEYLTAPLSIGKQIHVPRPGISALPGYVRVTESFQLPAAEAEVASSVTAEISAAEGRALLRLHRARERDQKLVVAKKRHVFHDTGQLACEACGFDFAAVYGELGEGFAECHHRQPLADTGETRTTLAELAVVCANCHRMLHRRPWRTVEELHELIRSRAGEEPTP